MIWIFQVLLDVFFVALAIAFILQGRKLLRLEVDLRKALQTLKDNSQQQNILRPEVAHSNANHGADLNLETLPKQEKKPEKVNTPLGSPLSTLSERNVEDMKDMEANKSVALSTSSRYALARKLLSDGLSVHAVAQRSGLSEAELALLGKLSSSSHINSDLH